MVARSLRLLNRSGWPVFKAAAWPYILSLAVLAVFSVVLRLWVAGQPDKDPTHLWAAMGVLPRLLVFAVFVATTWLPLALSFGSVAFLVFQDCMGKATSTAAAVKRVLGRWLSIGLLSILLGIVVFIGYALFVIPGILIQTFAAFAVPAMVIEDCGFFDSIGRSVSLVRLKFWRVAAVFLFAAAVTIGLELAVLIFVPLIFPESLPGSAPIQTGVGNAILFIWPLIFVVPPFAVALFGTVLTLLYYDAREKEVDVEPIAG